MLFLGDESTIKKLVELENEIEKEAKHYENLAAQKRQAVQAVQELIELNTKILEKKEDFAWAESKIRSMELFKQDFIEVKK